MKTCYMAISPRPQEPCVTCASTHSPFKDAVIDVVGAALRASEGEPLAVFVAIRVVQLERNSHHALSLFLPLVLLLCPELTWVQTWHGHDNNSSLYNRLFYPIGFLSLHGLDLSQTGQKFQSIPLN